MYYPLVSVLMTSYNREKYIEEAIESVLASTYKNFELIIVDDGSKDRTAQIAKAYEASDKRIVVYVNKENLGQFPNRNKAAGFANGELQMWVDSDDTIKPDAVEYIVEQFKLHPNAQFSLIYGLDDIEKPICLTPEESIKKHFYSKAILHVGPGGTVIRRDYFRKIGDYPTSYGAAGDSYFNIKAACNGNILLLPYVYFNYRIHESQEWSNVDAYLYYGYLYFSDAMHDLALPLTDYQKKQLLKKNKRRFVVNVFHYFFKTFNLKKTKDAISKTNFSLRDVMEGIFHFN